MATAVGIWYDKVDFARRLFATRRLSMDSGHGQGPWDDIGGAPKHILIDYDLAEIIFPPSSDACSLPHLSSCPLICPRLAA